MKFSFGVLYGVLCAAFIAPAGANVATTAGSNLTAYNGTGATNNNQWNSMMNARGGMASTADANFGNCEAVILRCASPKCGSGCADVNIARPIVAGCVNSNATCKKHGDALIESLAPRQVQAPPRPVQPITSRMPRCSKCSNRCNRCSNKWRNLWRQCRNKWRLSPRHKMPKFKMLWNRNAQMPRRPRCLRQKQTRPVQ